MSAADGPIPYAGLATTPRIFFFRNPPQVSVTNTTTTTTVVGVTSGATMCHWQPLSSAYR
jgi:hypothetical protein